MASRTYPYKGQELTFAQLFALRKNAISVSGLRNRLAAGVDPAAALTCPVLTREQASAAARKHSKYRMRASR